MNHKKISVLILGPHLEDHGGVSNFTQLLLNSLHAHDFCIKYFTVGKRQLFMYTVLLPLYLLSDITKFILTLISFKPDVIHINPSLGRKSMIRDSIYLFLAKVLNFKVLFFIHGWSVEVYKYFEGNNSSVQILLKKIYAVVDKIIVLADIFKKQLIELGVDASKIDVFPIMIEYSKYAELGNKEINGVINILFLANFSCDKGVYEVVKAIPTVLKLVKNRSIRFILAGDGPEISNVKRLIKQLNITNYVSVTGYVFGQKKADVFKDADIFVFPTSHGEGFPTVIAEAMAAGLPIISTGVGAIPEVIEDGINGIILSKPDEAELAEAIVNIINNPKLMAVMSKRNQIKAKDYDVAVVCNRLVQIYENL